MTAPAISAIVELPYCSHCPGDAAEHCPHCGACPPEECGCELVELRDENGETFQRWFPGERRPAMRAPVRVPAGQDEESEIDDIAF